MIKQCILLGQLKASEPFHKERGYSGLERDLQFFGKIRGVTHRYPTCATDIIYSNNTFENRKSIPQQNEKF